MWYFTPSCLDCHRKIDPVTVRVVKDSRFFLRSIIYVLLSAPCIIVTGNEMATGKLLGGRYTNKCRNTSVVRKFQISCFEIHIRSFGSAANSIVCMFMWEIYIALSILHACISDALTLKLRWWRTQAADWPVSCFPIAWQPPPYLLRFPSFRSSSNILLIASSREADIIRI